MDNYELLAAAVNGGVDMIRENDPDGAVTEFVLKAFEAIAALSEGAEITKEQAENVVMLCKILMLHYQNIISEVVQMYPELVDLELPEE